MRKHENVRATEKPTCLLCGNNGLLIYTGQRDPIFHAPGSWSLMQCEQCDFVWLQPRPFSEDIWKLYQSYHTHSIENHNHKYTNLLNLIKNSILATHMGYSELISNSLLRTIGRIFYWIGPIRENAQFSVGFLNGENRGKLLDVGCGSGRFLAKMKNLQWDVVGVEPDKKAAQVARKHFNLEVREGMIGEIRFPQNEFDVISMHHVIEHLYDPIETLKECLRVLKDGGKLVIITPNSRSLGHRLFKESWRGLEVPRHLQIFSSKSLKKCAEQAGFRAIQVQSIAQLSRYMWVTSRLIRKNALVGNLAKEQNIWPRLEGYIFWMIEYIFCRWKNVGEEIVLVATK
jgi:2-polyprenyl-3-methyl-5-hydroxy-6-metoxy-1,4-benzoquinol methylase